MGEAHEIAGEAAREGAELSNNLRELGVSLRSNAERLMRDVRLIHGSMVGHLGHDERVEPVAGTPRFEEPVEDLDVPEFVPRGQSGRGRSLRGSNGRR